MALADIIDIVKNAAKGSEVEVSVGHGSPLTLEKYVHLLETHVKRHKDVNTNFKILKEVSLDIAFNYDHERLCSHRITIYGLDAINEALNSISMRENHVVFSILISKAKNDSNISTMTKTRKKTDIIDIPNLQLRMRNSLENPVSDSDMKKLLQLQRGEKEYITYRFKERLSLFIHDDDIATIRTDITKVKQTSNIRFLANAQPRYEVEVELTPKTKIGDKLASKYLSILENEVMLISKIIQGSWQLIEAEELEGVAVELRKTMIGDGTTKTDLPGMQPRSLELPQLVDSIPTKYSVTDKADGDRYFLFIRHASVYLVSTNMAIKKIASDKKYKDWELTIIDGEYIYLPDLNKYLFLSFDIMFFKGQDIRGEVKLQARLDKMYEVMTTVFDQVIIPKDGPIKQHEKLMREYMSSLNKALAKAEHQVIMGKYFVMPKDKEPESIFAGSSLMWRLYTSDIEFKCPYTLDGLIYTSTEQKYTEQRKEEIHPIYKWKPKNKNSIDFYVIFEKDKDTGNILNVYDNTIDDTKAEDDQALEPSKDEGKYSDVRRVYRILNLYVGRREGTREYPVLFQKDDTNYVAKLYVDRNEVRDIEGKMLQDNTVVEFAYNNDINIEKSFRWVPLRTRFDKTEMVQRFKRKYGNNNNVSESIWRSMIDPIDISDLDLLGDIKTYDSHMKRLRSKVKDDALFLSRKEDAYYQEVSKEISKTYRRFHNFIKTSMINTYCKGKFGHKFSILDIACGKGGDIDKFYHARVGYYVGIDEDEHGIYSVLDGAKKRYENLKRTKPDAPRMQFFVADATLPLSFDDQYTKYGKVIEQDKRAMIDFFGKDTSSEVKQFDIINCQFAIHYFLKDNQTWSNFTNNIKRYLRKGGYLMFTTLDANLVNNQLAKTGKMTEYYTTEEGKQKMLYELVRMYPETTKNLKTNGLAIDVHMSWISNENIYIKEYLVEPSYIISELSSKCNMRLIETESFGGFIETNRYLFEDVIQFESNERTKKSLYDWAAFYNDKDPLTASLKKYSQLHRYYIFRMG
uniref:mRNA cap 0 methyltransferase domain-containing protein n=1 Tax=viral metagenome TaxID=1070528 RepID=A0A6C0M3D0_9ZZZZ